MAVAYNNSAFMVTFAGLSTICEIAYLSSGAVRGVAACAIILFPGGLM